MPGKNIIKNYAAGHYYHIYSRGVDKQTIFKDDQDYVFFLSLFKRYLSKKAVDSKRHGVYPYYGSRLELLTYCLMTNHIHLLIYQHDETAMIDFMRSVMTSYSMYFNHKNKRIGPLFQSRYRASLIQKDDYLHHVSRYIHLNPKDWTHYKYSSIKYVLKRSRAEWINPTPILELFNNDVEEYLAFLNDYKENKAMLDELKWTLA